MTDAAYANGIDIRVDSADSMNRADSPTLRDKKLKDFYENSLKKRAEKIEAEFQKLDNQEFLKN